MLSTQTNVNTCISPTGPRSYRQLVERDFPSRTKYLGVIIWDWNSHVDLVTKRQGFTGRRILRPYTHKLMTVQVNIKMINFSLASMCTQKKCRDLLRLALLIVISVNWSICIQWKNNYQYENSKFGECSVRYVKNQLSRIIGGMFVQ